MGYHFILMLCTACVISGRYAHDAHCCLWVCDEGLRNNFNWLAVSGLVGFSCFGSRKPQVQILPPRPCFALRATHGRPVFALVRSNKRRLAGHLQRKDSNPIQCFNPINHIQGPLNSESRWFQHVAYSGLIFLINIAIILWEKISLLDSISALSFIFILVRRSFLAIIKSF